MYSANDCLSRELESKRKAYENAETEICKSCTDRVGLPCLFVFSCEKKNEKKNEKE